MNIHFNNKEVFEELKFRSVLEIKMGSHMYGTNDENSDNDILYVYIPSDNEITSISYNHHQFQYNDIHTNTDHIFTDIFNFVRNSLNGDSSINFEVLNHPSLIGTPMEFIYNMRNKFHNHKVLRSYLGFARRDIKHISKGSTSRDRNKKLNHVIRSYYFHNMILNKEFSPIIKGELLDIINKNKLITDSRIRHNIGQEYQEKVKVARENLTDLLNSNLEFPQYMYPDDMKLLDDGINELIIN